MSAGPPGSRELRTAIAPSGSPAATSTQLPLGLLWALLRQFTPASAEAGMPLLTSAIGLLLVPSMPRRTAHRGPPAVNSTVPAACAFAMCNQMLLQLFTQVSLRLHD